MSSMFRLCKGELCKAENEFGLLRTKDSFNPGSDVCERCEGEVAPRRPPAPPPAAAAEVADEIDPVDEDDVDAETKTEVEEATMKKKCSTCRNDKDLDQFPKTGAQCKACLAEKAKARNEAKRLGGDAGRNARDTAAPPAAVKKEEGARAGMPVVRRRLASAPGKPVAVSPLVPASSALSELFRQTIGRMIDERLAEKLPGQVREALAEALQCPE